ncbi:hypothetical protein POVWA2_082970 [Plasmodium ovale wallikeri]|uniref:PIR Superfamily Protein n=1 Tax=Plasmodium ovale wallikeri TaxID=864142 RepID=A0A1A9APB6_PLAOA|nr:hypothetical protein POVWA2_082970 [Plasmodium ovale wallikeri]
MAGYQGYTTRTHDIPVEVFFGMITNDIKKLIHIYGHKNCGLRHKELCEKIRNIIYTNKQVILPLMNKSGQEKLISDWESQRNGFFNKLFQDEGFINMCYPFKKIEHQDIYQLLSRHVNFCKEKDKRRSALGENPSYSACVEYNSWIETEKASFYPVFLRNVSDYSHRTVKEYFSTKKHRRGHDPLPTYHHSKLTCKLYNPSSKKHKQKPVAKESLDSQHPPRTPDARKEPQGIGGISLPDGDAEIKKSKPDVQILQTKASSSDSQISSLSNTKEDDTDNGQNADLKAKSADLPSKDQGAKGQPDEATDTKAQSPEQLPEPKISISPKDSPVAIVPETLPSVTKDQGTVSESTSSTTSATSDTTHSIQNVLAPPAPDLPLAQPQSPTVDKVTAQHSKETAPPDPVGKSPNQDALVTSTLDPDLEPSQAAASNSILSETSSSTMTLTPGSPVAQDTPLPTLSTQPIVTTSVDTTITKTTNSVSSPPTITVSAMNTKPITSTIKITNTTGESGEPNSELKDIPNSQARNSASPKNQNNALPRNTGNQFPDASSSLTTNLNDILLPVPSSRQPPGLPSGLSLGGPAPALPASHVVVTKPGKQVNYNLFIQ